MRLIFALILIGLPLELLAGRGDPEICDPPPPTATAECGEGTATLNYFSPYVFGVRARDLCTRQPDPAEEDMGWTRVCEATDTAPHAQFVCREDDDHSVTCEAAPSGAGLVYLWESDESVILSDETTVASKRVTSFVCSNAGLGSISLTVSKPSGATSTIASDVKCTGAYEELLPLPCAECIPIDNPFDPPAGDK
ncbi:MAG TPA: hypothetical protein VN581_14550 [Patescibacteria group bacterium]|nr:hypothetical protein [Patescibacteria group bacterium]